MPDISRRAALRLIGAVAAGVGTGVLAQGYFWERHALRVERVDLPVWGLPPPLDGLRVGLLTDLHLSEMVPERDVERAVAMLSAERPDLVVLGGDYVSFANRRYMGPVAALLARLRAPHGVFAIMGNHDDDRHMPAALERVGVETLLDARTRLEIRGERIELAGLKFWTREMARIAPVLQGAGAPLLLLAHDPRRLAEAAALNVAAVLAGHTHGGQIVLPGIGAVAARKFPVASGRLTRDNTELYVSRGVGTVVVPLRVNCPPEVTVLTLRAPARQRFP